MDNTLPSRGGRVHFNFDVTDEPVLVSSGGSERSAFVMFNTGPNTVWGHDTAEGANPETGTPILSGGALVDSDSFESWYFATDAEQTADLRGWEILRP